jgi:ribose transport system ATP-binding protein
MPDLTESHTPPALEARNLGKAFGGVYALRDVSLTVGAGEIHAFLGENGSGKSTFIKVLSGYHRPDAGGAVTIGGREMHLGSPKSAHEVGCRFVHQDLGLIDESSIADNLSLGTGFPTRLGTINDRSARRRAAEDLSRIGLDVDPRRKVAELSPAVKTGVAVARALSAAGEGEDPVRLLVMDEPTATLPENEVRDLLEIVRRVAATGVGVLYVTHRIDEVFEIADNATVLRDGSVVATEPVSALDRRSLVALLVGSEFDEVRAASEALPPASASALLRVEEIETDMLAGVSFEVAPGDIVGIAGITGSGRESILSTIFGAGRRDDGKVIVDGAELPALDPRRAMSMGVAYLPADRKKSGGMMSLSARENLTLADLKPLWRRMKIGRRSEEAEVGRWFDRLDIRPSRGFEYPFSALSGGNQQKVLFAKWLRRGPRVILLDEPTQGVDIGAKRELHGLLLDAAKSGAAVVVSSSDVDELAVLCHRVLVLRGGELVASLSKSRLSVGSIARESLGAEGEVVAA